MESRSVQTIHLSDADVKQAVIDWLGKRFSGGGWRVNVGGKLVSTGYGPMERDEARADITAERDL